MISKIADKGVTDLLVAEALGINARQLRRWREAAKRDGENAFPSQGNACGKEMMLTASFAIIRWDFPGTNDRIRCDPVG